MFLKLGRYHILVKVQETLSYGCYVSRFGLCQVKGGNTDFIIFKNAIAFYFIVFFGVIGMGCCGLKRFPCAGDIFLILFEAARKCQHWSIRAVLLQLPVCSLPGLHATPKWLSARVPLACWASLRCYWT